MTSATGLMKHRGRRRAGFTLIELVLVIVIGLLAAGVAIPLFTRSLKAQRLRSSVRTVIAAGRYARSTAILKQVPMAILLDTEHHRVEVVALEDSAPAPEGLEGVLPEEGAVQAGTRVEATATNGMAGILPNVRSELMRRLEDGVRIVAVETQGELKLVSDRLDPSDREQEGMYWSIYKPNGMCDPYGVVLEDARGDRATVTIDPITGGATLEMPE